MIQKRPPPMTIMTKPKILYKPKSKNNFTDWGDEQQGEKWIYSLVLTGKETNCGVITVRKIL